MDADRLVTLVLTFGSVLVLAIALVIEHRRPTRQIQAAQLQEDSVPMTDAECRYHGSNQWGR